METRLKPKMVKAPQGCDPNFTAGKNYSVYNVARPYDVDGSGWEFFVKDDNGIECFCITTNCQYANGNWEVVGWWTLSDFKVAIACKEASNRFGEYDYEISVLNEELSMLQDYLKENSKPIQVVKVIHSELQQKAIQLFNSNPNYKITE